MSSRFGPGYISGSTDTSSNRTVIIESANMKPLTWQGDYTAATTYNPNDIVKYNKATYLNIKSSTGNLPTNGLYFVKMLEDGQSGTGINFKGAWSANIYAYYDAVEHNANLYYCNELLGAGAGDVPGTSTKWGLMLSLETYVKNTGKTGGQTIIGGTTDTDTLTLQPTSASEAWSSIIAMGTNIKPGHSQMDLGEGSTNSFKQGFIRSICGGSYNTSNLILDSTSNATKLGFIKLGSNTIPLLTDTVNLGSQDYRFKESHIKDAYINTVRTNTISEETTDAGVSIDGLLIKDGAIPSLTHSTLSNLSNDDHTQYALLEGRLGGQTLYGSTNASQHLTLDSTSSTSKGQIRVNSTIEPVENEGVNLGFSSTRRFNTLFVKTIESPQICGTGTASGDLNLYSSWSAPRDGSIKLYCGKVLPSNTTETTDLGATTSRWKDFFTTNADISTALTCATANVTSSITTPTLIINTTARPDTNLGANLGTTDYKWMSLHVGGAVYATKLYASASSGTNLIIGSNIGATKGKVIFEEDTESSSTTTGCATFAGGVGIAKNLNVGGNIVCNSIAATNTQSIPSDALTLYDFDGSTLTDYFTTTLGNATTGQMNSIFYINCLASLSDSNMKSISKFSIYSSRFELEFRSRATTEGSGSYVRVGVLNDDMTRGIFMTQSNILGANYQFAVLSDEYPTTPFIITSNITLTSSWTYFKIVSDLTTFTVYSKTSHTATWTQRGTYTITGNFDAMSLLSIYGIIKGLAGDKLEIDYFAVKSVRDTFA